MTEGSFGATTGEIMARQRHLLHAPITEALIDFQVSPRDGITFAELRDALEVADFGYYLKGPISQGTFELRMTLDQPPQTTAESVQVGLRFHSNDEKYVAQFRLTRFTLSRLSPYETWENLIEEATRLWNVYISRLAPLHVTRVGTRFINNLRLPLPPGSSYQTYLRKLVDVPEEAPQAVEAFFQRFQLVDTTGARVVLILTLDGMPKDGITPVILDVGASMIVNLKPGDDEEIWKNLQALRELKNQTFFGTITESAAELYE